MNDSTRRRIRKAVASSAVLLGVAASCLVLMAAPVQAAAPVLVNGGSGGQWLESLAIPKDTNGEAITVTFVVKHDLGTTLSGLAIDDDWGGTDQTSTMAAEGSGSVTTIPGPGNSNYSTIRYTFVPPNQPGFNCFVVAGTRRVNNTLRIRAVMSDGQRTAVVTSNVHSVENGQCLAVTDYPFIFNQSQTATQITPGQSVTFSFQGDDVDSTGNNDRFDKIRWRVRRLSDGAIVQGPNNLGGLNDNTTASVAVTFADRGRYVVEAEAGGEDDAFGAFENGGQFFRLGAVDVNGASGPTLNLSSPVVNDGASATVTAAPADPDSAAGGRAQMIRWDADNNGAYERRDLAADEATGLSSTQLQQSITTTAGVCTDRTVTVEVTDNGALNAADAIRRVTTGSHTVIVNCAPTANGQSLATNEDVVLPITLSGGDPDGDVLTYAVVTSPLHGSLTGGTGAARNYTPSLNYNGTDSFTFRTIDAHGRQSVATATVNITVNPVNDPPTAVAVNRSTNEDTPIAIDLTSSVSDVDGDTLTTSVLTPATNGNAVATGPRQITYSPNLNYNGADSFTYQVSDGNGGTASAGVNISVGAVDDPPVAANQSLTTAEETPLVVNLGPTTDVDGQPVTYAVPTQPANGSVVVAANQATYSPALNFNGLDSFVFTASDGTNSPMGTISITVTPVNDAPVADDQLVELDEDIVTGITLTGSDIDGDSLTYAVTSGPLHGTLDTTVGSVLVYTPDANYFGPDALTFQVNDGNGGTDTATVSITIRPVNDPPVADDLDLLTEEDAPVGVLLTAEDVENDALTFTVTSIPLHGALSGTAPNLVYTPGLNYLGPDSLSFDVDDGHGGTDSGVVTITVGPVNDTPAAIPQALTTDEDTALDVTLSGSDVDDTDLTFAVVTNPAHGILSGTLPDLVYTPADDYNGNDGFSFSVTDPDGLTDTAVVLIAVGAVNDNPVAEDQVVTSDEDAVVLITLAAADVDGDALAYSIDVVPEHGLIEVVGADVIYTPALNYHGPDSLVFRVDDGGDGIDFGTVDITVVSVNDIPDAIPQTVTVPEDTATSIELTAADVDGDTLVYAVTLAPEHGTLSGTAPNLTYTPNTDYNGPDSFTFSATDPDGAFDTANITLDVQAAPMLATTLHADASLVQILGNGITVRIGGLAAHLSESASGAPVAGAPITFTAGVVTLCTAVTDASGWARCGNIITTISTIVGLGYQAYFAGDADRLPSSAAGSLIVINNIHIF